MVKGSDYIRVEHEGLVVAGTRNDVIEVLREEHRLKYREIGRLTGVSATTVGNVLNLKGFSGYLRYPELTDEQTFGSSDAEISTMLGIPISRVEAARRQILRLERLSKRVNLTTRRRSLCVYLFEALPGPSFVTFVQNFIEDDGLPPKQAELVLAYYFRGERDGVGYDRYFRSYGRKALKERLVKLHSRSVYEEMGVVRRKEETQ